MLKNANIPSNVYDPRDLVVSSKAPAYSGDRSAKVRRRCDGVLSSRCCVGTEDLDDADMGRVDQ